MIILIHLLLSIVSGASYDWGNTLTYDDTDDYYGDYDITTDSPRTTDDQPMTTESSTTTSEPQDDTLFDQPIKQDGRLLSKMYLMVQHMEYGQTKVNGETKRLSSAIIQAKRFYYGCNCYLHKRHRTLLPSNGTPLDEYDHSCSTLRQCYASVNERKGSCDRKGRVPYFRFEMYPTDNIDLENASLEDREIRCTDSPCSCERMICECDAAFARANEIAHRKMATAVTDAPFNFYNYQKANDGVNIKTDLNTCDGVDSEPVKSIPNFPCANPFTTGLIIAGKAFDIFNYNHASVEEAVEFCAARNQELLPLSIAGNLATNELILGSLVSHINSVNTKFTDVEFWLPYKNVGVWTSLNSGEQYCTNSIKWNECNDIFFGSCSVFRQDETCVGVFKVPCKPSIQSGRYTVCSSKNEETTSAICRKDNAVDFDSIINFAIWQNSKIIEPTISDQSWEDYKLALASNGGVYTDLTDAESFSRFALKALWNLISDETRDETGLYTMGRWAFGSPNFLRFVAPVVILSHFDDSQVLSLTDLNDVYNGIAIAQYPGGLGQNIVNDETLGGYVSHIDSISARFQQDRKLFILIEYVFVFIWKSAGRSGLSDDHFDFLMWVRDNLSVSDISMIDVSDLAQSSLDFFVSTVARFEQAGGKQETVDQLRAWMFVYHGNSELMAKFALIAGLDELADAKTNFEDLYDDIMHLDISGATSNPFYSSRFIALVRSVFLKRGRAIPDGLDLEHIFAQATVITFTIGTQKFNIFGNHKSLDAAGQYCSSRNELLLPVTETSSSILSDITAEIRTLQSSIEEFSFWLPYNNNYGPWNNLHTGENYCPKEITWACPELTGTGNCLVYESPANCATRHECINVDKFVRYTVCLKATTPFRKIDNRAHTICSNGYKLDFADVLEYYSTQKGDVFSTDLQTEILDEIYRQSNGYLEISDEVAFIAFIRGVIWNVIQNRPKGDEEAQHLGTWAFESPTFIAYIAMTVVQPYLDAQNMDGQKRDIYDSILSSLPDGEKLDYSNRLEGGVPFWEVIQHLSDRFSEDPRLFVLREYIFRYVLSISGESDEQDSLNYDFLIWAMDNINAEDVETVEALGIDSLGVPYVSLTFKEFVSHLVSRYQTLFKVNPRLSVGIDHYTQPGLKAKFSLITFLRIGEVDEFIREVMGSLLSTNLDLTMTDPWDSSSFVSYLTTLLFDFGDVSVAEVFDGEFINLEDIYMYAHEISSTLNSNGSVRETLHTYARHDSAEEAFNFCASRGTLLLPLNGDRESSGILKQLSDHVVSFHNDEEAAFWTPYAIWEDNGSWINYLTFKEHCVADIDWRCNNQSVDHDNNGCLTYNPKLSCATHQLCTASKSERRYTTCATTQDTSTLVSGSDVAICRNGYSVDFVEVLRIFKDEFGVDPGQEVIDHVNGYHLYTRDGLNDDLTDDRSVYDFMRNAVGTYVDGKDRSDYAAKDVGKWIFESPNFILFSAAAVALSHLKENGGDQDDKIQLINTILNTPDTSVMTENFGEYGQYVQFLSSRWNFNRQRFLLNGYIFEFIWESSHDTKLTGEHHDYLFWTIENLHADDMALIDNHATGESYYQFLLATIARWGDHSPDNVIMDQLYQWAFDFSEFGDPATKIKHTLISELCKQGPCSIPGIPCKRVNCLAPNVADDLLKALYHVNLYPTFTGQMGAPTNPAPFVALITSLFADRDLLDHMPPEFILQHIFIEALTARFIEPDTPCPSSKCWDYDEETRICSPREDAGCWELTCGATDVTLTFESALFGVEDDDETKPWLDECAPTWNDADSKWTWSNQLGECMTAVCEDPSEMLFQITIGKDRIEKTVQVTDKISGAPIDLFYKSYSDGVRIRFTCHFPATISVSNSFNQQGRAEARHSLKTSGSFASAFSMATFHDEAFAQPVEDDHKVFVGTQLYVQVEWALKSNQFQFYLANCQLTSDQSDAAVRLIKDNCYSETLCAKLIGNHYSTDAKTQFSFQTFQFGTANGLRPLNHSETIACDVQVCLTGDNNKCVPNTSDDQCPSEPEGYNYKLIGGAHN